MQEQKATSSHYAKVATHYNHAFFYGDSINYQNRVLQKVLHHLQLKPSDQVVDIGCGTNNWGQSKINMVTRCSTFYNSLKNKIYFLWVSRSEEWRNNKSMSYQIKLSMALWYNNAYQKGNNWNNWGIIGIIGVRVKLIW